MNNLLNGLLLGIVVGIVSYFAVATALDKEHDNQQQVIERHIEQTESK